MEALVKTVDDFFYGHSVLVVIGVLADKDVDRVVELAQHLSDEFIVTEPDNPRKMKAEDLAAKFREKGKECFVCPDPERAIEKAKEMADEYDAVICAGSLYLIGKLRTILTAGQADKTA
jgi:dihydrofolate synthase/folylpolyglutamate synthase